MDFAASLFATDASYGPLVLRVGLAVIVLAHGAQKVFGAFGGAGFAGTMRMFTQTMHIPWFFALVGILTEVMAPIALFFGFFTRLAALALIIQFMVAAVIRGNVANGSSINWMGKQKGEGYEFHVLVITCAFSLMIMGCGYWGVDRWIARELQGAVPVSDVISERAPASHEVRGLSSQKAPRIS